MAKILKIEDTKIGEMIKNEVAGFGTIPDSLLQNTIDLAIKSFAQITNYFIDRTSKEPLAVVLKRANGDFVIGSKVEFIDNNNGQGSWSCVWSVEENDFKDVKCIEMNDSVYMIIEKFANDCGFDISGSSNTIELFCIIFNCFKVFLRDNYPLHNEKITVTVDGLLSMSVDLVDGELLLTVEPEGENKVMIKSDTSYQEAI